MRQHGGECFVLLNNLLNDYSFIDFQPRGRYPYNKRGGAHRGQNRDRNFDQQEQSLNNNEYQTTTSNPSNRNFNRFVRANMLEDPWANMKPQKVPSNGTSLVSDSTN
jgi:hypothetical protein